ncbi:MAG: AAA family ATPase [Clostridia bacterium]|nr:AAA family ATPase [Clostridia bacterium]
MGRKFTFEISFSETWLEKNPNILPSLQTALTEKLKEYFEISETYSKPLSCGGVLESPIPAEEPILEKTVGSFLKEDFEIADSDFSVKVEAIAESDEKKPTQQADSPSGQEAGDSQSSAEDTAEQPRKETILQKINNLIGVSEFKNLAAECVKVAPGLIESNLTDVFFNRSYLVSINEGNGLTTCLELFAALVHENKLNPRPMEVREFRISSKKQSPYLDVTIFMQSKHEAETVACIDISECINGMETPEFREFLKVLAKKGNDVILFFRVPFLEKHILQSIQQQLNDVLFVKEIVIPPFSNEELVQCATHLLSEKGFTMGEDAWNLFESKVADEKSDGRFYGIKTVYKIISEILFAKHIYNVEHSGDRTIRREEICDIEERIHLDKTGQELLDELYGIDELKEKILQIVAQLEVSARDERLNSPCMHMRFVGNPGTGKTTIARIIGVLLKERGVLRNGQFFEYGGRAFCGRYIGETAPKTAAICRDAYGSVLFIDEAYSLYRGDDDTRDFGREALDTLVAEMENHRSELVVIMAGYPDDMDKLMEGNPGLKSRMPILIEFPNYTREQLTEIFLNMARKHFTFDEDFEKAVATYFQSLSDAVMHAKDFSNARFARNLYERTWGKAALRCQLDTQASFDVLLADDFLLATQDAEFQTVLSDKKKLGFS